MAILSGPGERPAAAQHVVTDSEASKLTLDALTAAPRPVYRSIYRPIYRQAMAMRRLRYAGGISRAIHATAYRHHAGIHTGFRRHRR
ncbi:hypothetical protein [Lichenicoccus sp.]|uniref:hypothetical protein n=1 Tax=Lichenicoccus sp. TaxID=2781899 RepID=UPI003D11902B